MASPASWTDSTAWSTHVGEGVNNRIAENKYFRFSLMNLTSLVSLILLLKSFHTIETNYFLKIRSSGVNFINILQAAFERADTKSAKKINSRQFHQHFTRAFFVLKFVKIQTLSREKTFVQKKARVKCWWNSPAWQSFLRSGELCT